MAPVTDAEADALIREVVHALAGVAWVLSTAALLWGAVRRPAVASGPPGVASGLAAGVASASLAVLLLTGVWNLTALDEGALDGDAGTVLTVKLVLAVASFATAAAYRSARTRRSALLWAGAAAGTGVVALLLGLGYDVLAGRAG